MKNLPEKQLDFDAPLSKEADTFLSAAVTDFNSKQDALERNWQLSLFSQWEFDPVNSSISFHFDDGRKLSGDGQLIGTLCLKDDTFEWAWNNPRFPVESIRDSQSVKDMGRRLGITYLQAGMIPVPNDQFLSYLCAIFLKITNSVGMFRGGGDEVQPIIALKNLRWA